MKKEKTGIVIECKTRFAFQFLGNKPICRVNNKDYKLLKWNKQVFIPLQPDSAHSLKIQFYFMYGIRGTIDFNVLVADGEIHFYDYIIPLFTDEDGRIKYKKKSHGFQKEIETAIDLSQKEYKAIISKWKRNDTIALIVVGMIFLIISLFSIYAALYL